MPPIMQKWTPYHAKLAAYTLTRRYPSDSQDRLASVLLDAKVDLNPHQIDAALFAFQTPLSKGAILADEVGLGKTIEAGLVISQRWAERKRKILIITPSNLRKQWSQELFEKFFLPSNILEAKSWSKLRKEGHSRPFLSDSIVLCSYQFARNKAEEIASIRWDLVVFDEAHRLRNVYKPNNVIANTLKRALKDNPILLLSATPLQNSILELYGLVSFVDDHIFGDVKSFKEQYGSNPSDLALEQLRKRILPICKRTLRRQVLPYIRYTKRFPILQPFTPEEREDRLYNLVSDYLQRPNLQALPSRQRTLMTLIIRKLLASSTYAIAGTLETLSRRLERMLADATAESGDLVEIIGEDYEEASEIEDEWEDPEDAAAISEEKKDAIRNEIADLKSFRELALSITENAKGIALLTALQKGFDAAESFGGCRKAIIFTESRRTQEYLLALLSNTPWKDGLLLFNGTNTDKRSQEIYAAWYERFKGTDKISGSRSADTRQALVDYFRDEGTIMIATEAGAEGINLQFCSLVVNYDLPWNPQRIEQRIGRCHRYGQRFDVVVVNFLNSTNAADQRVYELLSEKFRLFDGVFGTSDEVLGAIESGIDFEKRIVGIYQSCRKPEDIQLAFDALQAELRSDIDVSLTSARTKLLENFDDEVREKLKLQETSTAESCSRFQVLLLSLTCYELNGIAERLDTGSFVLHRSPDGLNLPSGRYSILGDDSTSHVYRSSHPLALRVMESARSRPLESATVCFDLSNHEGRISVLEAYRGRSGLLRASFLSVLSLDQTEDYFIFSCISDTGDVLDDEFVMRLFSLDGTMDGGYTVSIHHELLEDVAARKVKVLCDDLSRRNVKFFEAESEKLESWADDLKTGLEREIKDIDRQIREARHNSSVALTLEEKLGFQREIRVLEQMRSTKRKNLFESQDQIDARRNEMIEEIEKKLEMGTEEKTLFEIGWRVR